MTASSLPMIKSIGDSPTSQDFTLLQNQWKRPIESCLARPTNQSLLLNGVALISGATVINHLLGRKMQGWVIVDINGAATIYRSSPLNDKTLTLTSSAAVTVNIEVF